MFVDYYNKNFEEIEELANHYRKNGYLEIQNFFDVSQLWRNISVQKILGKKLFAVFNGKFIVLEKDENITEDEFYKFLLGRTKKEKEQDEKEWIEEYNRKEQEWKEKISLLVPIYTKELKNVIDKKYHDMVEKCVNECLHSIYREYLVESLIELLYFSKYKNCEEIHQKLFEQNHSELSYNIIVYWFQNLSDKGKEYFEWQKGKNK